MILRLCWVNIFLINDFFESLALRESQDILCHVTQIYIFYEWLHNHDNKVFLCVHILLEKLDKVVVLKQDIQAHQVHLFEVWIRNSIINVMLRDERDQLSEKSLLLLLLLGTPDQFLIWEILIHSCKVISHGWLDLASFKFAIAHVVLLRHRIVRTRASNHVAYWHACGDNQLTFPFHHP